jgi:hypothetical protein
LPCSDPLDVTGHSGLTSAEVPGCENSRFERPAGPRQQHVNSEWHFVPVSFVLRLHLYRLFRFDLTRESVFLTTLTL